MRCDGVIDCTESKESRLPNSSDELECHAEELRLGMHLLFAVLCLHFNINKREKIVVNAAHSTDRVRIKQLMSFRKHKICYQIAY